MAAEAVDNDPSLCVRDSLLVVAQDICQREHRSLKKFGRLMVEWSPEADDIFSVPIALRQVLLAERPSEHQYNIAQATFLIGGEDERRLTVNIRNDSLDGDGFADEILEVFQESYSAHPHILCLSSLRQRRQAIVRRETLLDSLQQHGQLWHEPVAMKG